MAIAMQFISISSVKSPIISWKRQYYVRILKAESFLFSLASIIHLLICQSHVLLNS